MNYKQWLELICLKCVDRHPNCGASCYRKATAEQLIQENQTYKENLLSEDEVYQIECCIEDSIYFDESYPKQLIEKVRRLKKGSEENAIK